MTETITRGTLLQGHTSQENAFLVEDYPYGFTLRCQIRYWVETATKGAQKGLQRVVSQTSNPKRGGWNKPKAAVYGLLVFLYQREDNGHVESLMVSPYGLRPEDDAFLRVVGIYDQMPERDRAAYDLVVKASRRDTRSWEQWTANVEALADHYQATGEMLPYRDGFIGDVRSYIGERAYRVAVAWVLANRSDA